MSKTVFQRRARLRLLGFKILSCLAFGLIASFCLGVLAWGQGEPLLKPLIFGGACGLLFALLRYPLNSIVGAVDPQSDLDGLVRASLSNGLSKSQACALSQQAENRNWKFRPLSELQPFGLLALCCALVAVWQQQEQRVSSSDPAASLSFADSATSNPSSIGAPENFAETITQSEMETSLTAEEIESISRNGQVSVELKNDSQGIQVSQNHGLTASLIERYWILRMEQNK